MEQNLFDKIKQNIVGKSTAKTLLDNALIMRRYDEYNEKVFDDGHEPTAEEKQKRPK